jgi:hypothetical protein
VLSWQVRLLVKATRLLKTQALWSQYEATLEDTPLQQCGRMKHDNESTIINRIGEVCFWVL